MIELNIPGRGLVSLEYLVSDVNGTLAVDGQLIDGIPRLLNALRDRLEIHLLIADTHGRQQLIDQQLNLQAVRIQPGDESQQKAAYIQRLGAAHVVALGQGANDAGMLNAAAIGICVLSAEGVSLEAPHAADILASDIYTALELLEKPVRLVATLRK
jgi:soluble P-type ATPase